ncbi:helix-turn-helix domain-containing protein [Spirosoma spitsbergense]|uniref:helix-turn-helix domain-containing protein n=1 Tax=Spirosoma spitsbergense TaxID=431554 RepID=UPI000362558C|nr:helix-turn-helix transcriptional regulator [Spirosoma spitsbergense]
MLHDAILMRQGRIVFSVTATGEIRVDTLNVKTTEKRKKWANFEYITSDVRIFEYTNQVQPMSTKEQVGELIRETRKAKDFTQKELGEKIGVSESAFNRYENGTSNLSLETIEKVAGAMGLKVRIIFE